MSQTRRLAAILAAYEVWSNFRLGSVLRFDSGPRMAEIGAFRLLPHAPAKVPKLNRHRPFSLAAGSASSCPKAAPPLPSSAAAPPLESGVRSGAMVACGRRRQMLLCRLSSCFLALH